MASDTFIVALPKTPKDKVIQEIRRIAHEDTGKLYFLDHAVMRMIEREITNRQVLKVLRHGDVINGPDWDTTKERGWKCVFKRISAGQSLEVVAKLVERDGNCCLIITTY